MPPVVSFRYCPCGITYNVMTMLDGKLQTLICECQVRIDIIGTVLKILSSKKNNSDVKEPSWMEVSSDRVKGAVS
jgi:hypothetical protein